LARMVFVPNRTHVGMSASSCQPDDEALHTRELALRCRNELSMLHRQQEECGSPTGSARQALHRELDMFLDDATRSEVTDGATASEVNELKEKLDLQDQEIESLKVHIDNLEQSRQELESLCCADLEVAMVELWGSQQRLEQLEESLSTSLQAKAGLQSRLDKALDMLADQSRICEAESLENRQLRGERDALRALSAAELTSLNEVLTESLRSVHRAQQYKVDLRMDELLCVVCLSERKNVVLQPCSHLTMCAGCFDKCSNFCPQCRARVTGHLVIYM